MNTNVEIIEIKLMNHSMKVWEKIIDKWVKIRSETFVTRNSLDLYRLRGQQ